MCRCIRGFEGDGRTAAPLSLIRDLKLLTMCHGNTNKDKCRYGMGDFDHEIIHVTVDISKELQQKSAGLSTKLCFDFTYFF